MKFKHYNVDIVKNPSGQFPDFLVNDVCKITELRGEDASKKLIVGDVVLKINGIDVNGADHLSEALESVVTSYTLYVYREVRTVRTVHVETPFAAIIERFGNLSDKAIEFQLAMFPSSGWLREGLDVIVFFAEKRDQDSLLNTAEIYTHDMAFPIQEHNGSCVAGSPVIFTFPTTIPVDTALQFVGAYGAHLDLVLLERRGETTYRILVKYLKAMTTTKAKTTGISMGPTRFVAKVARHRNNTQSVDMSYETDEE